MAHNMIIDNRNTFTIPTALRFSPALVLSRKIKVSSVSLKFWMAR